MYISATVQVIINNSTIMGVIDSAAQVTVMDCDCWRKVMACEPVGKYISLRQVDGSSMLDAIIVPSVEITVGLYHTSITI